ncbi:MAG: hypothetical protein WKG07_28330 [Hymenobacter sp.]
MRLTEHYTPFFIMQNLTLSPKSKPGWASWRVLLPLLVLLVGLVFSRSAWGQQALFYDESVSFNKQPTNGTATDSSYAGAAEPGDAPYTTYRKLGNTSTNPASPNPKLGIYDINNPRTSQLVFTGASIVGDVTPGRGGAASLGAITQARVQYRVYSNNAPNQLPSTLILQDAGDFAGSKLYNTNISVDILKDLSGGVIILSRSSIF